MSWKQVRDADMNVGYTGGWCLAYVQNAFHTDHKYPTAMAAWQAEPNKHTDRPPLGITVPVYFSLGKEPAGHVAIRLDDGWVASSTQAGTHPKPYFHKSLDDLIAVYGQYNNGCKYLGWGEHVGSVRVVAPIPVNATVAQIKQAYLDILERPVDPSGLAHYQNYPLTFVKQDLLNSKEYQVLQQKKKVAAQEAATKQATVDAKAKADAEAAVKAQAETVAHEQAVIKQPDAVPVTQPEQSQVVKSIIKENNMNKIVSLIEFLKGKKTYVVSVLTFVASVGIVAGNLLAVLNGQMDWGTFMNDPSTGLLLASVGLASLKASVSKGQK